MVGKSVPEISQDNTRRVLSYLFVSLAVWSCLRLVFSYVFIPELWGVNLFHYLSTPLAIALTVVSLAGIYLGSSAAEKPKATKKSSSKTANKAGGLRWKLILPIAALFGFLFFTFQVAWPFLGDGTMYMGMLYNFHESGTITTQRTSAPVLYLLYGIYHLYLDISKDQGDSFSPFTFISLLSGMAFTITALRFAKVFDEDLWMRILFFTLLITLGGSLFFFGYVEMYPLQYTCVLLYAYFAYRYIKEEARISSVAVMLFLCILFHLQNALLIPSFIFLFSLRNAERRQDSDKRKVVIRAILISVGVLTILYILSQTIFLDLLTDEVGSPFIPFGSSGNSFYTLLSGRHLLDIVNYHFLVASIPLLLVAGSLVYGRASIKWGNPFLLFLLLNLFFLEAFLIGGGLSFGLARDWDTCATVGIFFALLSLALVRQSEGEKKRLAIPISVVSLCGAIGWIAINVNSTSASTRYADLLELYTPVVEKKITARGYENLRKFQQRDDFSGSLTTIRKMLELYPTPADARQGMVVISNQSGLSEALKQDIFRIIDKLVTLDDSTLLQAEFDKVRVGDPHSEQAATLGDFFEEFLIFLHKPTDALTLQEALQRCEEFISKHPNLPHGYETFGYLVSTYSQQPSDAASYLERAINIDPLRARPQFFLATALDKIGRREEAIRCFREGLKLDPDAKWGLEKYCVLLTSGFASTKEIPYLEELQVILTKLMNAPAKSSLAREQHQYEVSMAKELLVRVDRQLGILKSQQ